MALSDASGLLGHDFVALYDRCDQLSFLDGHVRAFEYFGAVPRRVIYDNLKPAVTKVVMPERELSARFVALCRHYLFEPCFARPGEGHDKGSVEARGKGIRVTHMVPIPSGETLRELSERLLTDVAEQGRTRADRDRDHETAAAGVSPHNLAQPVAAPQRSHVSATARVRWRSLFCIRLDGRNGLGTLHLKPRRSNGNGLRVQMVIA